MPEPRDPLVAACRAIIQRGSKSFAGAARLFAPKTREAAYLLYAWCRHCDDVIDGESLGFRMGNPVADRHGQEERLRLLLETTRAALAGRAVEDPAFQALQRVVAEYAIPHQYPLELIEGFAMDVAGHRFEHLDEMLAYCYHVAGVVGVMMAHVMGIRDEATQRRAVDLGIALQVTNIARDVVEDARAGRVYLPLDWLRAVGLRVEDLLDRGKREPLVGVVACLLGEAERYYASAELGIGRLPFRSAWAVAVAGGVYREIGRRVRTRGAAAWDRRVVVSKGRKLYWIVRGLMGALGAVTWGRRLHEIPRHGLWTRRSAGDRAEPAS